MPEQRRYETATTMPMVEEEITPRNNETLDRFAVLPAREGSKYLGLMCLGIGFVIVAVGYQALWLFAPAVACTGYGAGGLIVLNHQLEKANERPKTKTVRKYQHPEPAQMKDTGVQPVKFDLENNLPAQIIQQPRPAAFRSWLAAVLDSTKRVTFSKNQGQQRGWEGEAYDILIRQLRECGLLHESKMPNGAPVCTDTGKAAAQRWIER